MPFDLASAQPASSGFDLASATPVDDPMAMHRQRLAKAEKDLADLKPEEVPYGAQYIIGLKKAGGGLLDTLTQHPLKSAASLPLAVLEPAAAATGQVVADASAVAHSALDKIPGASYIGDFDPSKTFAQRKAEYETGIGKYTNPETRLGQSLTNALGATFKPIGDLFGLGGKGVGAAADLLGASPEDSKSLEDQTNAIVNASLLALGTRGTNPKEMKQEAPVPEKGELKQQAQQAYANAEQQGATISGESYAQSIDGLQKHLAEEGLNEKLMPSTSAALEHIAEHEGPLTIKQLETYRKVAKAAESAAVANPADMRMAGKIVDWIDDYMDNLGAKDIVKGNAKEAVSALGEARGAWSRYRKADTMDSLVDRAQVRSGQFSGSGFENALRTEFRQLALNKKKMGGFTAEEQAAIRKVATGGPIDNALRMAGKLAPTGAVSAAISGAGGFMAGGPIGAVAVPAAGGISRWLATRGTMANADAANLLMRRGPNPPPPTVLAQPGALNLAPLLLAGSLKDDKATTAALLSRKLQEAQ